MSVPGPETRKVTLNLRIEESLANEVKRLARDGDRTVSAQVRRMLLQALGQKNGNS